MARIIFMGTPEFALPCLASLRDNHEIVAVVTQPDRPAGRKRKLRPSPVKQFAQASGIPVFQPERMRGDAAMEQLSELNAALFVVAAYGQILPQRVLDIPPLGSLNVHASLLPRWRGAAPIQASIRAGDAETGVTIMKMAAGLDTGPTLARRRVAIASDETGQSLHDKLAQLGAELLIDTLPGYLQGRVIPAEQDESQATYAPAIRREEGDLDWAQSAAQIERTVRAYTPWPGTFTTWKGRTVKIYAGYSSPGDAVTGKVIERNGAVAIGCGADLYYPIELQLEGKRRLSVADFVNGYGDFIGAVLGE